MMQLGDEVVRFFHKQRFTIISTVNSNGMPHNACKGLVDIDKKGRVFLLDLYKKRTYANLNHNSHISITAVDEHNFKGWCLKGKARIIPRQRLTPRIVKAWEKKIAGRITHRLLKNITEKNGHKRHPESQLPYPEYMIAVDVEEVVDLSPRHVT